MDLFLVLRNADGVLQLAPGADIREALYTLARRASACKTEEVMQSGNTLIRVLPDITQEDLNLLLEEVQWEINGECLVSTLLGIQNIGPTPIDPIDRSKVKKIADIIMSARSQCDRVRRMAHKAQDLLLQTLDHLPEDLKGQANAYLKEVR